MPAEGGAALAVERGTLCDGSVYVAVGGVVEATSSCELLDLLIQGITPGRTLVVDLTAVTHADETGMAALAVAYRIASLHDGELRVLGCTGEAEQVLAAHDQLGGLEWPW